MWLEPSWSYYLGLRILRTQKTKDDNSKILYDDNPSGWYFDARRPCIHKASKSWKLGNLPNMRFIVIVAELPSSQQRAHGQLQLPAVCTLR